MKRYLMCMSAVILGTVMGSGCTSTSTLLKKTEDSAWKVSEQRKKLATLKSDLKNQRMQQAQVEAKKKEVEETQEKLKDQIHTEFQQMLDYCSAVMSKYEKRAITLQWTKFSIATIGAISGIVVPGMVAVAPVGNAAWIAALGGLSGVSNAAQNALSDVGLTFKASLKTRQSIYNAWIVIIDKYYSTDELDKKDALVNQVKGACTIYDIPIPDEVTNQPNPSYNLTVTKEGNGKGTVTSSTGGINCGPTCTAAIPANTSVTLIATADSGFTFDSWSGDCSGNTCTLQMSQAHSVKATFK